MNNIRKLRMAMGMTQGELASLCRNADSRVDAAMISRFECGVCLPTPTVEKAISTALRCEVMDLYGIPDQLYLPCVLASDVPAEPESMEVTDMIAHLAEADGPIRRSELAELLGCSDRKMRQIVEDARNCGYIIVNGGNGSGYFLASDIHDIVTHFRTEEARALSILKRLKKCRQILKAEGRI